MITNKCGDTNLQIADFMGVSRSILNYVIFCHQDDSYWPLEGGRDLKSRFDEIFGTATYNKAMDTVRKLSKTLQQEGKTMDAERKSLYVIMDEVKTKRAKLNGDKGRYQKLEEQAESIHNELEEINIELKKIQEKEQKYQTKATERSKICFE